MSRMIFPAWPTSTCLISPSGTVSQGAVASLVSGTALDGNCQAVLNLPAHSESGTWTVSCVGLIGAPIGADDTDYSYACFRQCLESSRFQMIDDNVNAR